MVRLLVESPDGVGVSTEPFKRTQVHASSNMGKDECIAAIQSYIDRVQDALNEERFSE